MGSCCGPCHHVLPYRRCSCSSSLVGFVLLCMGSCCGPCHHVLPYRRCSCSSSLVGFVLLCMGSCCGPCHHVLPYRRCSSRPSRGFHKVGFHQAPCMRRWHHVGPPSR